MQKLPQKIVHANSIITAGAAQTEISSLHNWDNDMEEFQMILKSYCQANSLLLIFSKFEAIITRTVGTPRASGDKVSS